MATRRARRKWKSSNCPPPLSWAGNSKRGSGRAFFCAKTAIHGGFNWSMQHTNHRVGGSERRLFHRREWSSFLGYLCGSEPERSASARGTSFLSCLRGSERPRWRPCPARQFLSCLRGSERCPCRGGIVRPFLSCLRGSERGSTSSLGTVNISELPARQRTCCWPFFPRISISELPARQRTFDAA